MTDAEFDKEALAQRSVSKYTTTGNSWKDGGFLGECVSLVNQYCWRVLNVPAGQWGNAIAWANDSNPNRVYFDKVSSPQAGDIGVLGAPYGELVVNGKIIYAGHIWKYTSPTTMIEQNGKTAKTVTIGLAYKNPIAILRRKGATPPVGDNMSKVDLYTARRMADACWGWNGRNGRPNAHDGSMDAMFKGDWVGRETNEWLQTRYDAPEGKAWRDYIAKLEASGPGVTVLKPGKYEVK